MLGERTAEEIKMAIGSAFPLPDEPHAEIRGRDLVSGPAEDDHRLGRGGPQGHRGAGQRHHRRGQEHPRQDPAGAGRRHHGQGHRPDRWWRAAEGPRRAAQARDRDADPHHREPAVLGRDRVRASASRSSRPSRRCSSRARVTDVPASQGARPPRRPDRHGARAGHRRLPQRRRRARTGRSTGSAGVATAVVRPIQDGIATLVRPLGDAFGGVTDIFSVRAENERLAGAGRDARAAHAVRARPRARERRTARAARDPRPRRARGRRRARRRARRQRLRVDHRDRRRAATTASSATCR